MSQRVCPWWLGYFLLGPVRRWWQDPSRIVHDYVTPGMTVLEPGPGMGFFTLELARLAGPRGRVVTVDVQPKMLVTLRRRAERAGLGERIETRLATHSGLGIADLAGQVGFVLAFAVVHEIPDSVSFFREIARALAPQGRVLLAEPRGHVSGAKFAMMLEMASAAGLRTAFLPAIRGSRAALLVPA